MDLRINSNISGMFALGSLQKVQHAQAASLARVASGQRLTGAADDAAGMQIANLLKSQAQGAGQGMRNVTDSIAMTQIADSALGQGHELLLSMREKALQAANASQSAESRQALQADIDKRLDVYNTIVETTTFNGQRLLGDEMRLAGSAAGQESGAEEAVDGLVPGGIDVTTEEGAEAAVGAIDQALGQINTMRGEFGARQNQLVSELAGLSTAAVNTWAAQSRVADADLAEESLVLARMNALRQTGVFALTQSMKLNQSSIMDLLQGKP